MRRGFTLLEMMVAVMILLVFVTGIYGSYTAAHAAMARAEAQEEVLQAGRVLLAQMTAEVASAYQAAGVTTSAVLGEDTEGAADDAQADRLTVLTTAHAAREDVPAGDLCRVRYALQDTATDETPGLYLEEDFTPDLEPDEYTPERRLLSPRVINLNCEYLAAGAETWQPDWIDQTALPASVRITLLLKSSAERALPVTLSATVNLAMATAAEVTDAEE
jgi:type II secretion system protein J